MNAYAESTTVPSDRSRAEIEKTLTRYGADNFAYATSRDRAQIAFTAEGRQVRFTVELPDRQDRAFTHTPSRNTPRSSAQQEAAYEQAVRQRWRALALMVKAKLEAVSSGIVTFEQEFLPHIMLPGGTTVYEATRAQIASQYETGQPAAMLQIGSAQ
jgi:hypothetical protein